MINGTNTVVTSIYELNYEKLRGEAVYKNFHLLTETIRALLFDEYNYVIYTDEYTLNKHNLNDVFNKPNIEIRLKELNSETYIQKINPIREKKFNEGEIYDRIYSVKNYIEVILNKLGNLIEVSNEMDGGSVIWLDSGLFGTSCHNGWRDYLRDNVVYKKDFLDKIFEKIETHNFISTKGNDILINYELKDRLKEFTGEDIKIIPGCLFGGKKENVLDILSNYMETYLEFIQRYEHLISEQELLSFLTINRDVKFFEFGDWLDLQKAFLEIMDIYDESKYKIDTCLYYVNNVAIEKLDLTTLEYNTFTDLADILGIDRGTLYENHRYAEIYEKYMSKFIDDGLVMLEIGIMDPRFSGKSVEFWGTLFPKLDYYGIDIVSPENLNNDKENVTLIQCDQNNPNQINSFINEYNLDNKFNVIIDDGSHESEHILTGFKTLFPRLKTGGYYFIEDLHAGWALRDITVGEIEKYLSENFLNEYEIKYFGIKLMLVVKL
jgi:hypothetical protein